MKERREGMWPWLMQRLTALYLVFGLALHFILTHVFMKKPITLSQVEARLVSKWFVLFDVTLLAACVYHAFNGVFNVYKDYNPHSGNRRFVGWILVIAGLGTIGAGVYILAPLAGRAI